MAQSWKDNHALFLTTTGLLAWLVPGAGHYLLNEHRRAAVIFVTVVVTFLVGLYVGSIGVIDPVGAKPWYAAQVMNSPIVLLLGRLSATGRFPVYGRPNEIGQIYTSIAGLLNLLCIVNAIYTAHLRGIEQTDD
jgi:hypothetical protein